METYNGHVRTPADAILLFEACRIGLLPRVQRRLSEKERQSIKSGSVFVWDEREAGMRRWTDGKSWSASRVSGSFLTYREMEGKRGGSSFDKNAGRDSVSSTAEPEQEDGPDGYRYKPDGLMKQSFSITTSNGQHLHLISYFSRTAPTSQTLLQPTSDPQLRSIRPEKGMYPESTVNEHSAIPPVTRGPMGSPGYTHSPNQQYGRAPHYMYGHPPSWTPPSPMHTPPPHGQYPYYHQPHPSHSQYPGQSNMQNMHYPPHPPHSAYGPAPPMTAFDRPPPALNGNGVTMPPQPPQQHYYPPPPQPHNSYSYSQPYPYHPPPLQSPPQHYSPQHQAPYEGRAGIPTHQEKDGRQDSHQNAAKEGGGPGEPQAPAGATPPHPALNQAPPAPPVNSGQTIPSISAMLNAGDGGQLPQRTSSPSPHTASPRPLQDIPSHKLGFEANRDVQALRNLDKSTFKY
nr:camp-independent regulatory protein pac2 [Quercus suber]